MSFGTTGPRLSNYIQVAKLQCVSSILWQCEYPKYTPLLAKILEGVLSQSNVEDKIRLDEEASSKTSM